MRCIRIERRARVSSAVMIFAAPASDTILIGGGDHPLQHLAEHGLLRTERLHAAVLQDQQLIDRLDADRPVRHHDHDGAALARTRTARVSASSPSLSRLEFGSSSTIRNGLP